MEIAGYRRLFVLFVSLVGGLPCPPAGGATWQVGPARTYENPSEVAGLVGDGDVVEIDPGIYRDVCSWYAQSLVLRGVGGRPHLDASGLPLEEDKAIWVIKGDGACVENIEFSHATCPDRNGAGIRQEGTGLTVRWCYFHDNEEGILTGADPESDILIEFTEFDRDGDGEGYSHNLYIGNVRSFTFRYCYTHRARVGHEVKSRADANYLLYNRISNEDGDASRCVDLPEGGAAYLIGNVIEQGPNAPNSNVFGFGLEGGTGTAYVVNNTFVNHRQTVCFLDVASGCSAVLKNNVFSGSSPIVTGDGSYSGDHNCIPAGAEGAENLTESVEGGEVAFFNESGYDFRLRPGSVCIDAGAPPGTAGGFDLTPKEEYLHPCRRLPRPAIGAIDLGSHEYDPADLAVIAGGDYNGDGTDDPGIFRYSGGLWSISKMTRVYFGGDGDLPAPGDYDGNGTAEIAVFRADGGLWAVRGLTRFHLGIWSDLPVPADYDGDGTTDGAIFRGSDSLWAVRNLTRWYYGSSVDTAAPGDYDGDGTEEPAVFRAAAALWSARGVTRFCFGALGDRPVPGDYDGDGTWKGGAFRWEAGLWAIRGRTRLYLGSAEDRPVPADYDGNGSDDVACFRRSSGLWSVRELTRVYFGGSGDVPVTR